MDNKDNSLHSALKTCMDICGETEYIVSSYTHSLQLSSASSAFLYHLVLQIFANPLNYRLQYMYAVATTGSLQAIIKLLFMLHLTVFVFEE